MTPEDLTPADKDIAQLGLLRIWLGRQKRAQWEIAKGQKVIVKRYDVNGRRILPRDRK